MSDLQIAIATAGCQPQNSYVEALTPNVTVSEMGPLEKQFRLNEVTRVGP